RLGERPRSARTTAGGATAAGRNPIETQRVFDRGLVEADRRAVITARERMPYLVLLARVEQHCRRRVGERRAARRPVGEDTATHEHDLRRARDLGRAPGQVALGGTQCVADADQLGGVEAPGVKVAVVAVLMPA